MFQKILFESKSNYLSYHVKFDNRTQSNNHHINLNLKRISYHRKKILRHLVLTYQVYRNDSVLIVYYNLEVNHSEHMLNYLLLANMFHSMLKYVRFGEKRPSIRVRTTSLRSSSPFYVFSMFTYVPFVAENSIIVIRSLFLFKSTSSIVN